MGGQEKKYEKGSSNNIIKENEGTSNATPFEDLIFQ